MAEDKKEQRNSLAIVARVIDDFTVVINRGSDDGVISGQQFLIYGIGEEITDPETNEPLGQLEIVRGRGSVIHTQPKMATIKSTIKQPSKVIKKRSLGLLAMGSEITEESNVGTIQQFEDVQVHDKAKPL